MIRIALLILLACLSLHITHAQNSRSANAKLVFATYQYADNTRLKNIEPFATYFASVTGIKAEAKSYPTVHALLTAMEKEEVDVAFMNTFGYLMLQETSQAYEICAALSIPKELDNSYKSVLVVNKNMPAKSLDDVIQNASEYVLTLVSESSTSGNLVPRLKLASLQQGSPEHFFLEVEYTNNHKVAREHALTNEYALCAFGSDEYYSLGEDSIKLRKLWESPPIPLGPVVFRKKLSGSVRDDVQKMFLALHEKNPEVLQQVRAGWTEFKQADRYKVVNNDYYDTLLKLSGNRESALAIIKRFTH